LLCGVLACNRGRPAAESAQASPTATASPSNSPRDPHYSAALDEEEAQENDEPENRAEARKAAEDYAHASFPNWKVHGISSFAYAGNVYIVSVDLGSDKESKTLTLVSRLFVNDEGDTYWKAEPLTPEMGQALSGLVFQKYQKLKAEYQELEGSYEELRSREDDSDPEPADDPRF
jgi:hypothetical protein